MNNFTDSIRKTADRIVDRNDQDWNMNIRAFDWVPGVGLHGIFTAYTATGEQKYLDFLQKWCEKFLSEAYTQQTVNSCAPLLTVIDIYSITGNTEYLKVCKDIAEYIMYKAPRTREGGLEHTVTEAGADFSEQIWADTLFMVCIFMAKMGSVVDEKYAEFALEQLRIHLKLLFDEDAGLFYHGWNCAQKNHMSGVFWGRANAWVIYATMLILEETGRCGDRNLTDYMVRHAAALKECIKSDGSFGTVLDDTDAYGETSATGGIAAGLALAVRAGILDDSYRLVCNAAVKNVLSMIDKDGSVLSVSTGTPVMPDRAAYKAILRESPTLYGQALAISAIHCRNLLC